MEKLNTNKKNNLSKKRFKKQIKNRNIIILFFFVLAFAFLVGKLIIIVFTEGDNFEKKVLTQAIQREGDEIIDFKRGDILDRNGIVLAGTTQVYNLIFDAKLLNSLEKDDRDKTTDFLTKNNIRTKDEVEKLLVDKKNSHYIVLEKGISHIKFENLKKEIDGHKVSGLFYEERNVRDYPYPTLAPEVIGFVKTDNSGKGGVEEYYNSMLMGEVGRHYGIMNNKAEAIDQEIEATGGFQVMLNIDYSIQKYITDTMENYLKEHNPKSVTIIVADPRNMEILGMKSYPNFSLDHPYKIDDLERPGDIEIVERDIQNRILHRKKKLLKKKIKEFEEKQKKLEEQSNVKKASQENSNISELKNNTEKNNIIEKNKENKENKDQITQQLAENPPVLEEIKDEDVISEQEKAVLKKTLLLQNRWKNIALTNGYEPGSIFKAVTYAVAQEENKINPKNYYCSGGLKRANRFIHCHKISGHGVQTAEQGLSNSCNVVFMEIGESIGRNLFYEYQRKFGFGAVTGIDLVDETSQRNNIYKKADLNEVQLATSSFGQGFNVTPIQMITAFSALINGGYLYEPHVAKKIFDTNNNLFEVKNKSLIRQVISEESSSKTRYALKGVVDEGTGRAARIAGYEIGGKTATSEKQPRGNGKYTVSFMGFAPIENPEVITLVIVDEPEGAYADSKIPSILFRDCMEKIMPYLHIFKTDEVEKKK